MVHQPSQTRPHVKICGLSDADTIDAALRAGAHEIGLVHFAKSPRHLSVEAMQVLRTHVGDRARVTIVTVDPDDTLVARLRDEVRPDTIQLHGRETPERVAEIRALSGLAVMKAIGVSSAADLAAIPAYRAVADRILLDARAPKGAELPGGNGVSFDWNLLAVLGPCPDIVLSGGLNPGNVAEAVRTMDPLGIDVSSGVESAPGVKDAARIQALFDAMNAASPTQDRHVP